MPAELAGGHVNQPLRGAAVGKGGLVVGEQLSSGQAAQLHEAEDASVDESDSTAIWRHVNSAAFLNLTLRRLLAWLQQTGVDLSRCQPQITGHCSDTGSSDAHCSLCAACHENCWVMDLQRGAGHGCRGAADNVRSLANCQPPAADAATEADRRCGRGSSNRGRTAAGCS